MQMPKADGQRQQWWAPGPVDCEIRHTAHMNLRRVKLLSESSFADRSCLIEVNVAHTTSGECLRFQLDGVFRQVRVNSAAVEVGRPFYLQPGFL